MKHVTIIMLLACACALPTDSKTDASVEEQAAELTGPQIPVVNLYYNEPKRVEAVQCYLALFSPSEGPWTFQTLASEPTVLATSPTYSVNLGLMARTNGVDHWTMLRKRNGKNWQLAAYVLFLYGNGTSAADIYYTTDSTSNTVIAHCQVSATATGWMQGVIP